jgi:hypothetical protein
VVPGSNGTRFDVRFAPQSALGDYTLVIGPDVRDRFGHRMDQDGNFTDGEPTDAYTATFGPRVHVLIVYSGFSTVSGWNDGSFVLTQVRTSDLAAQTLSDYDVIWVSAADSSVMSQSGRIADFVRGGGGLVVDGSNFAFVPNAADLSWVSASGGAVQLTDTGQTHPVTSWLTDADLRNQTFNYQILFTRTGGMDVLATIRENPNFSLILAGNFGSGHLVYFTGFPLADSSFEPLAARLARQAARWAAIGDPGAGSVLPTAWPSGGEGAASPGQAPSGAAAEGSATPTPVGPSSGTGLVGAWPGPAAVRPGSASPATPPDSPAQPAGTRPAPPDVALVDRLFAGIETGYAGPDSPAPDPLALVAWPDPLADVFVPDALTA